MSPLRLKFNQRSWRLANRATEAFVTECGGHLAPVTFRLAGRKVQPFAVAPWHAEKIAGIPPILAVLRGDFFCLPFGGNSRPFRSERHPPHGETANARWHCVTATPGHLHLRLTTRVRPGRVDKHVWIRPGQTVVYQRHIISGMAGPMAPGHHATLRFPAREGSGLISTSPFSRGEVTPQPLEDPAQRGYSCLQAGGRFRSLARVPTAQGGFADLSAYPARRGFEDLVMLVGRSRRRLAWTAVAFPGESFVWFALKDPRVLTNTVLWHSNGGRHYPPWNGRHVNTLGLEEATSYFHYGLAESAGKNPVAARGGITCLKLAPHRPLVVNYIMAVASIPRGFDHVKTITPVAGREAVRLTSRSGQSVEAAVRLDFLYSAPPLHPDFAMSTARNLSPSVLPANRHATTSAGEVLRFIHGLARRRLVLSGQFTNFGRRANLRLPRKIHRLTGRWPALVGVDYAEFNIKSGRPRSVQWLMNAISAARFDLVTHDNLALSAPNRVALNYWRAGGLVMIGAHSHNPANPRGGGLRDQGVDLQALLQPGTATHRRWMQQLDRLAAALLELKSAGVVVLWRPLHEMNGGWFWWGKKKPATFIRVWRHMFRHFSETKHLDNLLWAFSPSMGENAADYYPGDAFVDLVGFDAYTDHVDPAHIFGYKRVASLPKPFGFTEFGPHGSFNPAGDFDYRRFIAGVGRHFPKTAFFMAWNARWSPVNNRHARALYRHPSVLSRAGLPSALTATISSRPRSSTTQP